MHRTLDDLTAELRPMVFRLLDAGKPEAAAELIGTYAGEADAALWHEVLAPTEVEGDSAPADPQKAEDVVQPTLVRPGRAVPGRAVPDGAVSNGAVPNGAAQDGTADDVVEPMVVRPGKQSSRAKSSAGARARAAVGR